MVDKNYADNIIALLNRGIIPSQDELNQALVIVELKLEELTRKAVIECGSGTFDFDKLSQDTKSELTVCILRRDKIIQNLNYL